MDPHALAVLEFDKVRDLLARQAASALGLAAARELAPSDDAGWVRLWLSRTSEARRLLDTGEDLPLGGLHDIGPALAQAGRGGVLAPDELRGVAETLRCAANVRRVLRAKDDLRQLQDLALQLVELPHLVDEIERCITEDGEVADAASAECAASLREAADLAGRAVVARYGAGTGLDKLVLEGDADQVLHAD